MRAVKKRTLVGILILAICLAGGMGMWWAMPSQKAAKTPNGAPPIVAKPRPAPPAPLESKKETPVASLAATENADVPATAPDSAAANVPLDAVAFFTRFLKAWEKGDLAQLMTFFSENFSTPDGGTKERLTKDMRDGLTMGLTLRADKMKYEEKAGKIRVAPLELMSGTMPISQIIFVLTRESTGWTIVELIEIERDELPDVLEVDSGSEPISLSQY